MPVRHPVESVSRQARSSAERKQHAVRALQLGRRSQREHRAVRRQRRAQPRRGARQRGHDVRAVASCRFGRRGWSTRPASRSPTAIRPSNSLDPRCGGACTLENQGGPTLEVLGVASVGRQRFTPQPRQEHALSGARHRQLLHAARISSRRASISTTSTRAEQSLPLHFGGRYIFGSIPAAVAPQLGLPPVEVPADRRGAARRSRALRAGLRRFRRAVHLQRLFAVRAGRLAHHAAPDGESRACAIRCRSGPTLPTPSPATRRRTRSPATEQRRAAARRRLGSDRRSEGRRSTASYGLVLRQPHHGRRRHHERDQRPRPRPHARRVGCRRRSPRGTRPAAGCRSRRRAIRALSSRSIRASRRRTRITLATGVERELPGQIALSADFIYVRGFKQPSTLDYNPLVPSLGAEQTPGRRQRRRRHVGVRASVHVVRRNVVSRPHGCGVAALHRPPSVDDQLHAVEGRGQRHRLPERVHRAGQRPRTRPERSQRPAARLRSRIPKRVRRCRISGTVSSRAAFTCCRRTSSCRPSSRWVRAGPYNILAGVDLNGDGDGGATDRARARSTDIATSVQRNAGTLPMQATVDLRLARRFAVRRA